MRTLGASLVALVLAALLGGCRSSAPCGAPCAPAPTACETCTWADPVYANGCGGDPGVGRDGTGAFAR
jgi:hypothetical protein